MHLIETRYDSLGEGRFSRKTGLDRDLRPGELSAAIRRAKAGDELALRYLYLRFSGNVYGYARGILRDEHDAEDVTQQVFARLLTSLQRYQERSVPFSAWLLRITHNMAIDHLRRRGHTVEEPEVLDAPDSSRSRELAGALREAIEELPAGQREVVVLRHVAGWSPSEIATALDKTEDAVHGLHHRGRRLLKEALVRRGAVPATLAA